MKHFILLFSLVFLIQIHAQSEINYGENSEKGKFLKVNNINLYYEIYGEGEPILLIHGNKTGIKGWKPQIEYFSKNHLVIAVDCRGRGKSELGNDSLSYDLIADDLLKFLEILKIDSISIIGKSDGGIVALLMGISGSKYIKKIVSFGANVACDSTAFFPETINEIKTERKIADEMILKKDLSKNWKIEQQRNRMMEFQPHISQSELAKINVPVLVMSCDRDVIKEEHTLSIYNALKLANLCILPGEVHRMPSLNPLLFNVTVESFIINPFKNNSYRFK